ncbi:MAG: methyltransferase domain-containing protein [Planctomycetes bacterium]|nr:methyltransferase domain-containing protein [Planctomycetota bacterium]
MSESTTSPAQFSIEREVARRYSAAAHKPEAALCCPIAEYDTRLLDAIPNEVLSVDYGCGDPSQYARPGETVVDLGSGSGKACFMIAQRVGPTGRVIGVDANDDMLALSRRHAPDVARRIGHDVVSFAKGRIQDLRLDLDALEAWIDKNPVGSVHEMFALEAECTRIRSEQPLIADGSVDLVVSNCVLNLVRPADKTQLFDELHRVLKRGGRVVISDIVSDEDPTPELMADPELWSGCISGAFREDKFLEAFERAGFYGIEVVARSEEPWHTVAGIEFRSITVRAFKGKEGPCLERNQAVVYRGPWRSVTDDDGHVLARGQRIAVCDKTFKILTNVRGPYSAAIVGVPPITDVPLGDARPSACEATALRDPAVTKGADYRSTRMSDGTACTSPECC